MLGKVPGKPGLLDTATSMAMDADFTSPIETVTSPRREPTPEVEPPAELRRITGGELGLCMPNQLFYGDNLAVGREHVRDDSNASYNVLFNGIMAQTP